MSAVPKAIASKEVVHVSLHRRKDSGAWEVVVPRPGLVPLRESSRHWNYEQALKRELELLSQPAPDVHTIGDALRCWMVEFEPYLNNPRSYDTQARCLAMTAGHRLLTDAALVASDLRASKGLKPGTVNRRLALLRRLCNLAHHEWGWLPQAPSIRVLSEKGSARHVYLTRAKVEALRTACVNRDAGELVMFSALTGVRLSELFRIKAEHVVNGVLRLDARTKNGSPRSIPLHPRALLVAERMPLAITSRMLRREWDLARTKTSMQHVHWHDLRHTFASWLVQAGVSILEVKELMGHSTIEVTMRYAHLAPDSLAKAIAKLE